MAQIICRYRKGEAARWISHLDVKRTLERAMRRAELPLTLTEGHNPHLKLSFGPPLSVGITGDAEMVAVHLDVAMAPDALKERLNAQLPPGLQMMEAWAVPGYRKKETFGDIDVAEYRVAVQGCASADELRARMAEVMASEHLIVQRGGDRPERSVDLRPLVLSLAITESRGDEVELKMRLKTGSHGGARPQEVVSLLGVRDGEYLVRYHRTGLYASAQEAPRPAAHVRRRWTRTGERRQET
jgi:radical SAM-linked protein